MNAVTFVRCVSQKHAMSSSSSYLTQILTQFPHALQPAQNGVHEHPGQPGHQSAPTPPHSVGLLGRLAEHSSRTCYEPSMSVVLLNPGDIRENFTTKHKFCCTATSAEHVMTVPSYTSQSWEKRDESSATPLLKLREREREA